MSVSKYDTVYSDGFCRPKIMDVCCDKSKTNSKSLLSSQASKLGGETAMGIGLIISSNELTEKQFVSVNFTRT